MVRKKKLIKRVVVFPSGSLYIEMNRAIENDKDQKEFIKELDKQGVKQ